MPTKLRFDTFELDLESVELRKSGRLIKLQPQPFRVLLLLIERAGHVVSRDEIRRCLWKDSTFVDFEHGINFSVNQIRAALGDRAIKPRYVETLPRRGYRFVGRLEPEPIEEQSIRPALEQADSGPKRSSRLIFTVSAALVLMTLVLVSFWYWRPWPPGKISAPNAKKTVAVVQIKNLSQDPSLNWLGDGLVDLVTTDLAHESNLDVISSERVRSLIGSQVKPGQSPPPSLAQETAQKAGADVFVNGEILKVGQGYRLDLRVQDSASGKVLIAERVEGASPTAIFSTVIQTTEHIVSKLSPESAGARPGAASLTSNFSALREYEEGISYRDRYMYNKAVVSFRRAIELDPQFAMAYLQLGSLSSNYREGHANLTRAAFLAERQSLPEQQRLLIRARQLSYDQRIEEAVQTFQTIVGRFPKEIEPRALLGSFLGLLGRFTESAAELEQVAKLNDPTENGVWNELAYAYAYQGDFWRAFDALDKYAARLPPNDPNPIDTRADVYAMSGNPDKAISEYQRNLESHPEFAQTRHKVALAFLLAGRNQEAEESARTAYQKASVGDRAYARNVQGNVALGRGDLTLAANYFEQASRLIGPEHPATYRAEFWKAAEIYFELGEPQTAFALANRNPSFPAAEVRGVADLLWNKDADAEKEFSAAREAMVPFLSNYSAQNFILFDRIRADSYSGQWHRVIAGWAELPEDVKQPSAFFAGRAYAELGLLSQAEGQFRTGLRWVVPGNLVGSYSDFFCFELTHFYLGRVLEKEGKDADASKSYRAFLNYFEHSKARLPQISQARRYVGHSGNLQGCGRE